MGRKNLVCQEYLYSTLFLAKRNNSSKKYLLEFKHVLIFRPFKPIEGVKEWPLGPYFLGCTLYSELQAEKI